MEIRPLEAFVAVVSTGSITGAARLLDRSQPAVTRLIQDLEAEIGFELFHRNGPRISPTERGVRFHAEIERLLNGFGHLRERIDAIGKEEPLPVEIAATPALAVGLVPAALARLANTRLPRRMHLRSAPPEEVVQLVLTRSADIGISSLPIDHPGLEVHSLFEAPCVVALPSGHPLADRPVITLKDFSGERMTTMANPYRLRGRVDQALREHGAVPSQRIDTNTSLNALQLVRAGLAVGIVEPVTAFGVPLDGVVIRPLDIDIPFLWGVVTALARPLTPTVKALTEALDAAAADFVPRLRRHGAGLNELVADTVYGSATRRGASRKTEE